MEQIFETPEEYHSELGWEGFTIRNNEEKEIGQGAVYITFQVSPVEDHPLHVQYNKNGVLNTLKQWLQTGQLRVLDDNGNKLKITEF